MNTVIVDAKVALAAPSPAGPPVLDTSICHRASLLRSTLPLRTRIATTRDARTDGTSVVAAGSTAATTRSA